MKGKHYNGYWFMGYKDGNEMGPFTTTHLCRSEMHPDGFRVSPPVCGAVKGEHSLFHGFVTASDVRNYKGRLPGTDIGCHECRKRLNWCVLHDMVEEIEDEC